jgi:hypothetical protein
VPSQASDLTRVGVEGRAEPVTHLDVTVVLFGVASLSIGLAALTPALVAAASLQPRRSAPGSRPVSTTPLAKPAGPSASPPTAPSQEDQITSGTSSPGYT